MKKCVCASRYDRAAGSTAAPSPFARTTADAAARPFSAAAAPQATARRPHDLLSQVNTLNWLITLAVAPPSPTSSAENQYTNRARRRDSGDGGQYGDHRWILLIEAKLMVSSPRDAVDRVAGEVSAGDGGEFNLAGARAKFVDPTR